VCVEIVYIYIRIFLSLLFFSFALGAEKYIREAILFIDGSARIFIYEQRRVGGGGGGHLAPPPGHYLRTIDRRMGFGNTRVQPPRRNVL